MINICKVEIGQHFQWFKAEALGLDTDIHRMIGFIAHPLPEFDRQGGCIFISLISLRVATYFLREKRWINYSEEDISKNKNEIIWNTCAEVVLVKREGDDWVPA